MGKNQEKLLIAAHALIGTPYKYAVKPEEIPRYLDCSSFTKYVYGKLNVDLERSTILQATQGREIAITTDTKQITADLEIGDLLFFRGSKGHYNDELFPRKEDYIGHVAIYKGDNQVIHASSPHGVIEESIDSIIKTKGPIIIVKRIL